MVSTVVFNGHVDTVDPATGQKIRPPLISMRATREKFDKLVLTEPRFDPVASIKRHFFAAISQHPEELKPVDPVMPFSQADPRVVEAIDVISTLDQRPNLLELSPEAFESFVQNCVTKMGYETDRYRSSRDGVSPTHHLPGKRHPCPHPRPRHPQAQTVKPQASIRQAS
jgi:restriction system protein